MWLLCGATFEIPLTGNPGLLGQALMHLGFEVELSRAVFLTYVYVCFGESVGLGVIIAKRSKGLENSPNLFLVSQEEKCFNLLSC